MLKRIWSFIQLVLGLKPKVKRFYATVTVEVNTIVISQDDQRVVLNKLDALDLIQALTMRLPVLKK